MKKLTRAAITTLATLAIAAPASAVVAAPAPTHHAKADMTWTVIERGFMAKHQACKKSISDGDAWRVFNRLDSSKVTGGSLRATMTVMHNDKPTHRKWSSGWVRPGNVSDVGYVNVLRKPGFSLTMSLAGHRAGSGGEVKISDIGHC